MLTLVDFLRVRRGTDIRTDNGVFATTADEYGFFYYDPDQDRYQGSMWLGGTSRFCYVTPEQAELLPFTRRHAQENMFRDAGVGFDQLDNQAFQQVIYLPHRRTGDAQSPTSYRLPVEDVHISEAEALRRWPNICAAANWGAGLARSEMAAVIRGYYHGFQFGLCEAASHAGQTCIDRFVQVLSGASAALYGRNWVGLELAQSLWNNRTCAFDLDMMDRQLELWLAELKLKEDIRLQQRAVERGEG